MYFFVAWDQTSKFVKFYITLLKVHTIPEENIHCSFTNKSLELTVKNLDNKDYLFTINNLLKPIDPEHSNWKVKSGIHLITDKLLLEQLKIGFPNITAVVSCMNI